mgnify:CR=1 FL=1
MSTIDDRRAEATGPDLDHPSLFLDERQRRFYDSVAHLAGPRGWLQNSPDRSWRENYSTLSNRKMVP